MAYPSSHIVAGHHAGHPLAVHQHPEGHLPRADFAGGRLEVVDFAAGDVVVVVEVQSRVVVVIVAVEILLRLEAGVKAVPVLLKNKDAAGKTTGKVEAEAMATELLKVVTMGMRSALNFLLPKA